MKLSPLDESINSAISSSAKTSIEADKTLSNESVFLKAELPRSSNLSATKRGGFLVTTGTRGLLFAFGALDVKSSAACEGVWETDSSDAKRLSIF